jgi:hypothetical protein
MDIPLNVIDIFKYPLNSIKINGIFMWNRTLYAGGVSGFVGAPYSQVEQEGREKPNPFSAQ